MKRPPLPAPPHEGGCLCRAVRYSYNARPLALSACHCTDCKKLSGASYFAVLQASSEHLSRSGETVAFRKRADSGREIDIHRCAACGTRLWHAPVSAPQLTFIAAGTLDDPSWFVPTAHIWTRAAQPDVRYADDALVFEAQPADRQQIWDAFGRLYPQAQP